MRRELVAAAAVAGIACWLARGMLADALSLGVAGWEDPAGFSSLEHPDAVEAWMVAHPEQVSLVVWSVGEDGVRLPAVPGVVHRPEAQMPAGALSRLPAVVAWADDVVSGLEDADAREPLSAWDLWWLPTIDRLAHHDALARLELRPGWEAEVRRRDIVAAGVRGPDPAALDWLTHALGARAESASSGVAMDMGPSLLARAVAARRHGDVSLAGAEAVDARWTDDPAYREEIVGWFTSPRPTSSWEVRRSWQGTAPRATASDLARLVGAIATRTLAEPEAARRVAGLMEWPMSSSSVEGGYRSFGGMGDLGAGWAAEAVFSMPNVRGTQPIRVVVLLLSDVGYRSWTTMASSLSHQQVVRRLLDDPLHAEGLQRRLARGRP